MSMWLTNQQLQHLQRAYQKRVECPVPTQVISSGECFPPPQTRQQAQVESLIQAEAGLYAGRQGIPRQTYLRSSSGMAAAFLAMNQVHGRGLQRRYRRSRRSGGSGCTEGRDQEPIYLRRSYPPRSR